MKYIYRLHKDDGEDEIATITVESEAITVTRKKETSTSKGKPTRTPRKLCAGESVQQEARVQQLKLEHEGFVYESTSNEGDVVPDEPLLYVVIRQEHFADVIEFVTGSQLPPGVSYKYVNDVLLVRDDVDMIKVQRSAPTSSAVVKLSGGIAALALVLCHRGWAELTHETQPGPTGSERVDPKRLFRAARRLPAEFSDYMTELGVTIPGVLQATDVPRAVLF
jgi:hypothetical protein